METWKGAQMHRDHFTYKGRHTDQISFPLGGLGTGCVGLAGNGRLIDWEIFNRPNKGSVNGFSHFAIRAEREGEVIDARVLNGDLQPPYVGELQGTRFHSYGFGPPREYLTGVPHFRETQFCGRFPIAELSFLDPTFPGQVEMTAFNPFIPHNTRDSGIPAAFFEVAVENTTDASLIYTVAGTLHNPLPANNLNVYRRSYRFHWLHFSSDGVDPGDLDYGTMTLATDAGYAARSVGIETHDGASVNHQAYWFRGRWFDDLEVYWHDFTTPGPLKPRTYPPHEAGEGNCGTLSVVLPIAPGEIGRVRFIIAWHFPNRTNDWNPPTERCADCQDVENRWQNYYALLFKDSEASARYALGKWDMLYERTRCFQSTFFESDLPEDALDAVSANLSVLKSPTVMRLEDGTFYGFEGCHPHAGCCEGSCTHVWNYAQALPFLFPSLARSMREANYAYNVQPNGGMGFRLQLPLGVGPAAFRPCADGQFGEVMKAYRDWKISGDTEWLRGLWPEIRRSIEFAWSDKNEDRWDPDRRGVLDGRQHHTLDMELFGPNAWLTGFYLGALKAGSEMAEALGEPDRAALYRDIFDRGKAWVDRHLFNGDYYVQSIALDDRSLLEPYATGSASMVGDTLTTYWDTEHEEIKYQIGEGCGIDQVLAQWHANLYGLGEIFDPIQTRQALAAVFAFNFMDPLRAHFNPCRVFGLNDEAGLVICTWPEGTRKPVIPIPYAQEAMHGFEYAAAIQMIQSGLIEEGMAVVTGIRMRYDGERRNPWNEFECGSHYARSMASYALLNAFSGFSFDGLCGTIGFDPIRMDHGKFRCFWSLGEGWGVVDIQPARITLDVLHGRLRLRGLRLPFLTAGDISRVSLAGTARPWRWEDQVIVFGSPVDIDDSRRLVIDRVPR
jgi:uncharacterized protein (DUF608 family)